MRARRLGLCWGVVAGFLGGSFGQTVLFNDPVPWITMRSSKIVARTQLDTSRIKDKKVELTLTLVSNGQKKVISKKAYPANDVSKEYELGVVPAGVVGGYNYLKIDWAIPGTKDLGDCAPFGLVPQEMDPKKVNLDTTMLAKKVAGPVDEKVILAEIAADRWYTAKDCQFGLLWDEKMLYIAYKKTAGKTGTVAFSLDGKNAKNAYLAYPDRTIRCFLGKDSLYALHYGRNLKDNKISYEEKAWTSEVTMDVGSSVVVIRIPWYDPGVLPFEGRKIGFAAFLSGKDGKQVACFPQAANSIVPGTWGNLVLVK